MEKERGAKVIAVIALLVAVAGLTIGYAAYSSTLTINGTATVDPANWNVKFAYTSGDSLTAETTGLATQTTAPTLTDTAVSGFDVVLRAPGDSITYKFSVKNTGTLDATLGTYTMGTLSCAPNAASTISQEDATKLCNELQYTLTYSDGSKITTGATLPKESGSKDLVLKLVWPESSTLKVTDDVKVTIGTTTFIYNQA